MNAASLARNVVRLQWLQKLTNLPRFQGARPDHVQVESSRSRFVALGRH